MVKNCLACGALNDADASNCLVCGAEFTLFQENQQSEAQKNKPKNTFQSKYQSSTKNQILYQFTPAPILTPSTASTFPQVSAQPRSQATQYPKKATISPIYRATASRGPKDDPFLLPDDVRLSAAPIAFPAVSAQHKNFLPQTIVGAPNPQTFNGPFVESAKDLLAGEDFSFLDGDDPKPLDLAPSTDSAKLGGDVSSQMEIDVSNQNLFTDDFDWNFNTNQLIENQQVHPVEVAPLEQEIKPTTEYLPTINLNQDELDLLNPTFDHQPIEDQGIQPQEQALINHTAQHQRISDLLSQVSVDAQKQDDQNAMIEQLINPKLNLTPVPLKIEGFEEEQKNNHLLKLWSYLFLLIGLIFFAVYAYLSQTIELSYELKSINRQDRVYTVELELNTTIDEITLDVPESLSYTNKRISDQKILYQLQIKEEQLKLGTQNLDLSWSYRSYHHPFALPVTRYYELQKISPIQEDGYYHVLINIAPQWSINQSNGQEIKKINEQEYEILYAAEQVQANENQELLIDIHFQVINAQGNTVTFHEKHIAPISQLSLSLFYPSLMWKRQEDSMLIIGKTVAQAQITVTNLSKTGITPRKTTANALGIFELQMPIRGTEEQRFEVQAQAVGYEIAKTEFIGQRMEQQAWFNHKGAMLAKGRQQLDSSYQALRDLNWVKLKKIKFSAKVLWVAEHQKNEKNEIFQYFLVEYLGQQLWLEIKNPHLKGFEWVQRNHQITIYGTYISDQSHIDMQAKPFTAPTIKIDHLYWF